MLLINHVEKWEYKKNRYRKLFKNFLIIELNCMKEYCPNCSRQITEADEFCQFCGAKLSEYETNHSYNGNDQKNKDKLNIVQIFLFIIVTALFLIAISWPKFHNQATFSTNILIGILIFTIVLLALNFTTIHLKKGLFVLYFLLIFLSLLQFNAVSFIISVIGAYFSSSNVNINLIAKKEQKEELDKEKTNAIKNIIFKT